MYGLGERTCVFVTLAFRFSIPLIKPLCRAISKLPA
jgi:hypothetical protein